MNIGVLFGGRSFEHDISIITAVEVISILKLKYNVFPIYAKNGEFYLADKDAGIKDYAKSRTALKKIDFTRENGKGILKVKRKKIAIDCMLMCCHGGEGENGIFSAIMEYYGFPYTAPNIATSALTMDKWLTKISMAGLRVRRAKGRIIRNDEDTKRLTLKYPLIVKPLTLGSSIGISIAHNSSDLENCIAFAKQFDKNVLVESMIDNVRELNCACFLKENEVIVSAVEEPNSWHEFLTFEDKYIGTNGKKSKDRFIKGDLAIRVQELTKKIYKALGLFGVVRIDYLYDEKKDVIYINEINSQPGSLSYYLFEKVGITFSNLLDFLIKEGITRNENMIINHFNSGILNKLSENRAK